MTRLNLAQTCLLDVSGELGAKAKAQLAEHVEKYPAALLEYELIRGQFDLLRSLPKPELSDEQKREMASAIKQGVHRKLREREEATLREKRARLIYRCMAGVSSLAACVVVGVAVWMVQEHQHAQELAAHERVAEATRASEALRMYFDSDTPNYTDFAYDMVDSQISRAEDLQEQVVTDHSRGAAKLLEDLDVVLDQAPLTEEPGTI